MARVIVDGSEVDVLIEQCLDYRFLKEDIILNEATGEKKKAYFVEGVFLQSQVKNRNGRIYPVDVMGTEVDRYVREMVERNRAVGELGHPDGPTINPERVSHKIVNLMRDGNNFIGKARISNTPFGKIAQVFLDEEIQFGVSSRGIGTLRRQSGADYVQPDFRLATAADIVMDPSAPDAFVRGIMENKEYILADGLIQEASLDKWKRAIKSASMNRLHEAEVKAYGEFLSELDSKFKF